MIIDRRIQRFLLHNTSTIHMALERIAENREGIVFVVDDHNHLQGLFTNGDFMRWLVQQSVVDMGLPVLKVINRKYIYATEKDEPKVVRNKLRKVNFVPIVDKHNHLIAVARHREPEINIGSFSITANSPTFIIAEIGINHNGSIKRAKELVDAAADAGANCAKFQMRDLETLYVNAGNADDASENLGTQYTLDLLSRFELTPSEMFDLFDHCKERGLVPLCTPWDLTSLRRLETYEMPGYKVASADMTNHELLRAIAATGKPLLCSTGMSYENEIRQTVELLQQLGTQYILLQCNSTYPAPFKDINLRYLPKLAELGNCFVGYSGHERGYNVAVTAVAFGAKVIEKHFTFDRDFEGSDHKVSLLPDEFAEMVIAIREVEEALGSDEPRQMTQGEQMNRVNLSKSLIANTTIKKGEVINRDMIMVKSPGRGLQPNYLPQLLGRRASRDMSRGDFSFLTDLGKDVPEPRDYKFSRPWGIPVRYHDHKRLIQKTKPDFLEFHLSYKDMDQEFHQFFDEYYDMDLVVHSPDLFTGDHILNLAADDNKYRQRSIKELQRVVDLTLELKQFFRKDRIPLIVASLGGFTQNNFVEPTEIPKLYDRIADSLSQIDSSGVEIIGQTLPPFPWYFGGQLFLNLFVNPIDTANFCEIYGYRLCLDISHSKLACNHFGWSFKEFVDYVGPYVAHLHVVDAKGIDSEGLQIGDGEIDFLALGEQLKRIIPNASFIPEIWQGHENNGEGFWIALERLERLL